MLAVFALREIPSPMKRYNGQVKICRDIFNYVLTKCWRKKVFRTVQMVEIAYLAKYVAKLSYFCYIFVFVFKDNFLKLIVHVAKCFFN
jgi:hypothetical protein